MLTTSGAAAAAAAFLLVFADDLDTARHDSILCPNCAELDEEAPKLFELRMMPDEQVERAYDEAAKHTVVGTGFYLDELS
jgi:hypothetical protein